MPCTTSPTATRASRPSRTTSCASATSPPAKTCKRTAPSRPWRQAVLARNPYLREILECGHGVVPAAGSHQRDFFCAQAAGGTARPDCAATRPASSPRCAATACSRWRCTARHWQQRPRTIFSVAATIPGRNGGRAIPGAWNAQFGARLRVGRAVQRLFGGPVLSEVAVGGCATGSGAVRRR
ncbi:MAG: hypothetical protein WKG07_33620 [Hymenobacter sp.]